MYNLQDIINGFLEQLLRLGIRVEKIFYKNDDEEIEIIIISKDFHEMDDRERFQVLGIASSLIPYPIEAQGYTPDELIRLPTALLGQPL